MLATLSRRAREYVQRCTVVVTQHPEVSSVACGALKRRAIVLAGCGSLLATGAGATPALQPGTLCQADEQVLFSCPVKKGKKIASLCGSKDLTDKTGYLQYRFGRAGSIELEFPKERRDTQTMFRYAHYLRPQVDRFAVSFALGGYTYAVVENYEGDIEPTVHQVGVLVTSRGQEEREIACSAQRTGEFHSLKAIVPCDRDDPLNMGGCPVAP